MDIAGMKAKIDAVIEREAASFVDLALAIAADPELGHQEFRTSKLLVDSLRGHGWEVEYPFFDLATAFNAKRGSGSPVVSFCAEYDALPEIGHACGHNVNGAISLLGGIALAEATDGKVAGEIRVVGTPAEETSGAKVAMSDEGVFDDVDFAMMVHAGSRIARPHYRSLALEPIEFTFRGQTSHAAASPWDGRNALNGAMLFMHALDMLRQHVLPDTRIHGIIRNGGEAANIVPDVATVEFYFRSPDSKYLAQLVEKVHAAAKGCAMATQTTVEHRAYETGFASFLENPAAESLMGEVLDEIGVAWQREEHWGGSTDMANVSRRCPAIHLSLPITDVETPAHTREFATAASDKKCVTRGIIDGAKAIARMGLIALTDADARAKMKADWQARK